MTVYILIVTLYYNRAGITAEFNTLENCKSAGERLVEMDKDSYGKSGVKYICMEK